jgi:hypothetical protein
MGIDDFLLHSKFADFVDSNISKPIIDVAEKVVSNIPDNMPNEAFGGIGEVLNNVKDTLDVYHAVEHVVDMPNDAIHDILNPLDDGENSDAKNIEIDDSEPESKNQHDDETQPDGENHLEGKDRTDGDEQTEDDEQHEGDDKPNGNVRPESDDRFVGDDQSDDVDPEDEKDWNNIDSLEDDGITDDLDDTVIEQDVSDSFNNICEPSEVNNERIIDNNSKAENTESAEQNEYPNEFADIVEPGATMSHGEFMDAQEAFEKSVENGNIHHTDPEPPSPPESQVY